MRRPVIWGVCELVWGKDFLPHTWTGNETGRRSEEPLYETRDGVAVIDLSGMYYPGAGFGDTDTMRATAAVRGAARDQAVRGLVLRIDSPGGSVESIDRLAEAVRSCGKPVVAVVENMCASAAYYVASQANAILAGRNDLIGSIGTYILLYDMAGAYASEGIRPVLVTSGKFKGMGVAGMEITEDQQAELQRIVDYYFSDFKTMVGRGRKMSRAAVEEVADGRLFPAPEAQSLGLIDGIGGMDEAVLRVARGRVDVKKTRALARLALT